MEFINKRIENLLFYGEKYLNLSPEGKAFARNRLLELLQVEPSYKEAKEDEDIEEVLFDLTDYAVENGIIDEELADKFPDKLLSIVMPSQDDVMNTYSRIHLDRGRYAAESYFRNLMRASGFIKKPQPGSFRKFFESGDGEVAVVIPSEDRPEDTESFYPKCPYCLENLGFCGLPGESAFYTKRVLPFELDGLKWHFSYREKQLYEDEYVVARESHVPTGEARIAATLADLAEKVPTCFSATDFYTYEHDRLFGGKRVLPEFERPVKKTLYDGDFVVSTVHWCFSVIRIKAYIKSDLVRAAAKIMKYWQTHDENNVVYPAFYCTEQCYMADIALLKRGKSTPLFDKMDYLAPFGIFLLPAKVKEDIMQLADALGQKKVDFGEINDSPNLSKYLEWAIQIAAARGTELPRNKALESIVSAIGETCLHAAEDWSVDEKTLEKIVTEALK